MSPPLIFDIETGPLPLAEIQQILPPFDPESLDSPPGTLDFQEKQAAEADHWARVLDRATLSALTGQVVAIGYRGDQQKLHLAVDGIVEADLIERFWQLYAHCRQTHRPMAGFNITEFDVPFIAQRSWILGIPVPDTVFVAGGRLLDPLFIDLFTLWQCSKRQPQGSLDVVCRACGIGAKPDGVTGADFAGLLASGDPEKRQQAEQYLTNDLALPARLAERLGVR